MTDATPINSEMCNSDGTMAVANSPEGATHPIFGVVPGEDSGSDTLGRYRYQAEVAARDCLAMLTQDVIDFLVCEWHEDFIIAFTDGSVELVSVKHREEDQGPWTLVELCKSGGVAHLFDRWCACESADNVRLRLATNAALSPTKGNAGTLAKVCGPQPELVGHLTSMSEKVARQMLKIRWKQPYSNIPSVPKVGKIEDIQLPVGFLDKVARFLAVLEISCEPPQRAHITDVNIQSILAPAVQQMKLVDVDMEATYKAIVDRIEQANRDESDRTQLAVHIADPSRVRYSSQLQLRISRRTLTRGLVRKAFVFNAIQLSAFPRGKTPTAAPGGIKLNQKLRRGLVATDEAAFAEKLRSAWFATWSERRSGLAGDETDLLNLSLEVLDTVFKCRSHARGETVEGDSFGVRMNDLIVQQLTVDALSAPPPFSLNNLHLRGLAYQLCDDCHYFFSEPFDADGQAS